MHRRIALVFATIMKAVLMLAALCRRSAVQLRTRAAGTIANANGCLGQITFSFGIVEAMKVSLAAAAGQPS